MALEMNTDKVICPTCGTGYSKRKGFFPVSYGELYKGLGYIPYCRSCIDKIYSQYLAQCKSVNSLNTLIGSLNLKPAQKKSDELDASIANTPLGVWLFRYENKRPLPEIDKSLQDVNRIKKYVFTWLGHICKMCGVKNGYTRLYEDEINRLRVEKPEYEDEDDESLLIDAYSENQGGDE